MDEAGGGGWPPENSQPTTDIELNDVEFRSVPSPAEFVSIGSDSSSLDVEQIHKNSNGAIVTIKRKKHSKKQKSLKKSKELCQSQDSIIPLGQASSSSNLNMIHSPVITQITDSFASPSGTESQTPGIPAYVPSGRQVYKESDKGPFVIHVQRVDPTQSSATSYLHPINFGRFLNKNNFIHIVDGSIIKIGRNRISLSFSDRTSANNFITNDILVKNNYKAFIPTFNTTRIGLVKGIPLEWTEDEVIEYAKIPIDNITIIKVRRLNYKVYLDGSHIYKPTQTCVLTFDGQILPERIYLCYNSLVVERYYYPTIQCFNCCRFGHTKVNCRSNPRCFKCGQAHSGDTCNAEEGFSSCLLCSGLHFATNKCCPEYNRQKSIKISMSDKNISYAEALKLHPPVNRSFSDVAKTSIANVSLPSSSIISSHKKTVFLKPRPPPPQRLGYDRAAHQSIIASPPTSSVNGLAYPKSDSNTTPNAILELIQALTQLLNSSVNNVPSNVAQANSSPVLSSSHHGLSRAPVELQKHK